MLQVVSRIVNLLSRSSADSTRACARVEFLCFPLTPSHRGEGSEACISSPRKPNGLSHGIFECLIVEASSQAQNHLRVLADRYTERCRGVFDCTGDGECDNFGSGWTRWPRRFGIGSGALLPKSGVVGWSLMSLARFDARSDGSGLD